MMSYIRKDVSVTCIGPSVVRGAPSNQEWLISGTFKHILFVSQRL